MQIEVYMDELKIKKWTILVFLISLFICCSSSVQCQTNEYRSEGETINGLKEGQWVDINEEGIICKKYFYKNGIPVGTWIAFGTYGRTRYESVISDEKIVNVKIYFPKGGCISIIYQTGFLEEHYRKLLAFEDQFFKEESYKEYLETKGYKLVSTYIDDWKKKLDVTLKSLDIDFDVKIYHSDGTMRSELSYSKECFSQTDYYYDRNNLLKRKEVFENDKLIKTIRYKKGVLIE